MAARRRRALRARPRRPVGGGTAAAVLAVAAGGALAGCAREPWEVDRDRVLRVVVREYAIEPTRIRTGAGRIVILARNEGRLLHGLEVVNDEDARGDRRREFARARAVAPGARLRPIRLRLPRGRYRLVDPQSNHEDLGASADLEVLDPDDPRLDAD